MCKVRHRFESSVVDAVAEAVESCDADKAAAVAAAQAAAAVAAADAAAREQAAAEELAAQDVRAEAVSRKTPVVGCRKFWPVSA